MGCGVPCPDGRTAITGAYRMWCALSGWPDGHNGCLWDVVCPVQTPRSHSAVLAPCGACVPCPEAHRQPVSTSGWPDGHNGCLWGVVCPIRMAGSGRPDGHDGCLWGVRALPRFLGHIRLFWLPVGRACPAQTPRPHSAVLRTCGAYVPCPDAHRQPVSTRFGCPAYRTRFGCSAYRTRYGRPAIRTRTLAWGLWGVYNRAAMSKTQKLTKKDDDHAAKTHS